MIIPDKKFEKITEWSNNRVRAYKNVQDQLDMLWHDIDSGKFGEDAKTGELYLSIKAIKDSNPKPDNLKELKQELADLIEADENA
jgi:hypothetical protein